MITAGMYNPRATIGRSAIVIFDVVPILTRITRVPVHVIETEAAINEAGQVYSLRFYLDGKAFTVHADEGFTLRLDEYEAEEPDSMDDRLDHVLRVLGESGPSS